MIHDVAVKGLQINVDERGLVTKIWRSDWGVFNAAPEMSYVSVSHPGIIRAWHRHRRGQVDHFVVPRGKANIGIYDDRDDSPTRGELNTFVVGDGNMQLVRIPGDCWHGEVAM
jgi:dTDP-4-dehydrorhamnose 3,5-epimerase